MYPGSCQSSESTGLMSLHPVEMLVLLSRAEVPLLGGVLYVFSIQLSEGWHIGCGLAVCCMLGALLLLPMVHPE